MYGKSVSLFKFFRIPLNQCPLIFFLKVDPGCELKKNRPDPDLTWGDDGFLYSDAELTVGQRRHLQYNLGNSNI